MSIYSWLSGKKIALGMASLASLAVLSGCGGGGGGGNGSGGGGGGGNTQGTTSLKITLQLPAGFHTPSGGLFLSGGLFDKAAVSGTTGTIKTWSATRQLVGLVDSSGNPVLIGWVAPGRATLSASTTAVALLYLAIAGYEAADETQEGLIESLEHDADLAKASTDINAQLVSSGNISASSGAFRSDIQSVANSMLGPGGLSSTAVKGAKPSSVTIDPSLTTKSGIQVTFGQSTNEIVATNNLRRRALLFLDKVSTTDASGHTTPTPSSIGSQEIDPAVGVHTGSLDVIGNLGGFPTQSTATVGTVSDATGTTSAVTYKVTAAGPGTNPGEASTLTTSEENTLSDFLRTSFVKDFFMPFVNRMLVTNTLTSLSIGERTTAYALLENAVDTNSTQTAAFVSTTFPNALADMQQGNYRAANTQVVNALQDNAKLTQFASYYATILAAANLPGASGTSTRFSFVFAWLSHALGSTASPGSFNFPQFAAFDASNKIDSWQVVANQNKVNLKANPLFVMNDVPAQLTTQVTATVGSKTNVPPGDTLVYTWSTTGRHGDLTVGSNPTPGVLFKNTTFDGATFGATTGINASEGTDTVTVQVGLQDAQGNVTQYGSASIDLSVQAKNPAISLVPQLLSVEPGSTTSLIGEQPLTSQDLTNAAETLRWHCPNKLGKLNASSTPGTQVSTTYTAGPNQGSEIVTCDLIKGGKVIGTAQATVKIEKKPTTEFGEIIYRDFQFKEGTVTTLGCACEFRIPKVAGAKSYSVHCYNFYDPLSYGRQYNFAVNGNGGGSDADTQPDGSYKYNPGDPYWYKLGPGETSSGDGSVQARVKASCAARFQGMQIEVTVSY